MWIYPVLITALGITAWFFYVSGAMCSWRGHREGYLHWIFTQKSNDGFPLGHEFCFKKRICLRCWLPLGPEVLVSKKEIHSIIAPPETIKRFNEGLAVWNEEWVEPIEKSA